MRFVVSKELKQNRPLRILLAWLALFTIFFLIADIVYHVHFLGLTPQEITRQLHGDETLFIEPMPPETLLLHLHMTLFFSFVVALLSALTLLRLQPGSDLQIHFLMSTSLASPLLLGAAYLSAKPFVILWLLFFYLWHIVTLSIQVQIIRQLQNER